MTDAARTLLFTLPLKLHDLFRRRQVERELDDEIRYHLEQQIEENVARGMTPEEARFAALRAFGGVEYRKEKLRDQRGAWRLLWLGRVLAGSSVRLPHARQESRLHARRGPLARNWHRRELRGLRLADALLLLPLPVPRPGEVTTVGSKRMAPQVGFEPTTLPLTAEVDAGCLSCRFFNGFTSGLIVGSPRCSGTKLFADCSLP